MGELHLAIKSNGRNQLVRKLIRRDDLINVVVEKGYIYLDKNHNFSTIFH
jgi:hypothetical protein